MGVPEPQLSVDWSRY